MYQENEFLQRNDVTLQNIDQIYQIDRKRRLLNPHSKINPNLEGLYIVCKVRRSWIRYAYLVILV